MLEKLRRRNRGLKSTRLFAEELETREVPATLTVVPPGTGVNGDTQESELSATGRYVVFSTLGTNVLSGVTDANGAAASDVYLFDRVAGTTKLISRSTTAATTTANAASFSPKISDDGQFVVFQSLATDLVAGFTDGNAAAGSDVYLYNVATDTISLVSKSAAAATTSGNGASYQAVISGNGQFIAYTSLAANLITGFTDNNGPANSDVFLYSVAAGTTTLVSRNAVAATASGNNLSEKPTLSIDGSAVAYDSVATDLVTGQLDVNANTDVFLFDRAAGTNILVSRAAGSTTTTAGAIGDFSYKPQVSGDGQTVVFLTSAPNLITGVTDANTNGTDVYVFSRATGTMTLVSRSAASPTTTAGGAGDFADYPDPNIQQSVISDDGNVVAYLSTATNVVTGQTDTNGGFDVFAFNRTAGTNALVSHASGSATTTANATSASATVNSNGLTVAFESAATNLVASQSDANGQTDVFAADAAGGPVRLLSGAAGSSTQTGAGQSSFPKLSADGSLVSFISNATNLVSGVTATQFQTYVTAAAVPQPPTNVLIGSGPGGSQATLIGTNGAAVGAGVNPFPGFTGGIRTAQGDVNGDGVLDFIFGTGPGATSQVVVLDGVTRAEIARFTPFEASFTGGVYVASGDIDRDGRAEVIVTPDVTGGPRVLIYTGANLTAGNTNVANAVSFFGINDPNFRGGARAAVGDMNRDGIPELVVAAGFLGGPRITIYDGTNLLTLGGNATILANFFVFESTFRNGAFVAVGDVNGDGFGDLIAGAGETGAPRVRILSGQGLFAAGSVNLAVAAVDATQIASFFAGDPNFRGGVRVTAANLDNDSLADVVTGAGQGTGGTVIGYTGAAILANPSGPTSTFNVAPFGSGFNGGIYVG